MESKNENLFEIDNLITTNNRNCLKVVAANENRIVCEDLSSKGFTVFSKDDYKFEKADIKKILQASLQGILENMEISKKT